MLHVITFPFGSCCRPEMVVGWYHSHPGFGCWLSGVDINTQQVVFIFYPSFQQRTFLLFHMECIFGILNTDLLTSCTYFVLFNVFILVALQLLELVVLVSKQQNSFEPQCVNYVYSYLFPLSRSSVVS